MRYFAINRQYIVDGLGSTEEEAINDAKQRLKASVCSPVNNTGEYSDYNDVINDVIFNGKLDLYVCEDSESIVILTDRKVQNFDGHNFYNVLPYKSISIDKENL